MDDEEELWYLYATPHLSDVKEHFTNIREKDGVYYVPFGANPFSFEFNSDGSVKGLGGYVKQLGDAGRGEMAVMLESEFLKLTRVG